LARLRSASRHPRAQLSLAPSEEFHRGLPAPGGGGKLRHLTPLTTCSNGRCRSEILGDLQPAEIRNRHQPVKPALMINFTAACRACTWSPRPMDELVEEQHDAISFSAMGVGHSK
jgi:hypothetical protein